MTVFLTEPHRPDPDGPGYLAPSIFEGLTILAEPCPTRESRVWDRADGSAGVTYASHSLKLATFRVRADGRPDGLCVLVSHGGGHERLCVPDFYDNGDLQAAILALPERLQYAMLYTLAKIAREVSREAERRVAHDYASAFIDGRLRKSRPTAGRRFVTIEPKEAAHAL